MHLNLFVSNECFVYCRGCYSISKLEKRGKYLSTEEIIDFLKYAATHGVKKVTLCGGDPLTRKDISDLLEKIFSIGLKISIDTVGTSFIKDVDIGNRVIQKIEVENIAKVVDVIGIPIDGSTDEICRTFRNRIDYSLKEQMTICELLHSNKVSICINTVIHKQNLHDYVGLCKVMKKLPFVEKWQIFQFSSQNNNCGEDFEITYDEFCSFKEKISCYFRNSRTKIEFKSCKDRENLYVMVDNDGNVWNPSFANIYTNTSDRIMIGNIKNRCDWELIIHRILEV